MRRGFSLLEVIIAMSLFFMVVVALTEAAMAARVEDRLVTSEMAMLEDIDRTRQTLIGIFHQVAPLLQFNTTTLSADLDSKGNPIVLMPNVNEDQDSIEFVRLRQAMSVSSRPGVGDFRFANFISGTNSAKDFSAYADAKVTPFLIYNDAFTQAGQWFVSPVWESSQNGLTFAQNACTSPSDVYRYLRVYRCRLIPDVGVLSPDPSAMYPLSRNKIRTGRFVCEYFDVSHGVASNASATVDADSGTWSVMSELATGVDCATVTDSVEDTFKIVTQKEDLSLSDSAVRFEMTIHRPITLNGPWPTMKRRIVVEVAMPRIGYGQ